MSRRVVTTLGVVAAAGAGYYFYSAGGDPKVAQKMAERKENRRIHMLANVLNRLQAMLLELLGVRERLESKAKRWRQGPARVSTTPYAPPPLPTSLIRIKLIRSF